MAKGYSLHIGVNYVNEAHYGTKGALNSPENDAEKMEKMARKFGYSTTKLTTKDATREIILPTIQKIREKMEQGDIFFLTYSGHGCRIRNLGSDVEPDNADETWALYDGQWLDDEIWVTFSKFDESHRIIVFLDSCQSEGAIRAFDDDELDSETKKRIKALGNSDAQWAFENNKEYYKKIVGELPEDLDKVEVAASVLEISACRENQKTLDGNHRWANSLFTSLLLKVWKRGRLSGTYQALYDRLVSMSPNLEDSHPQLNEYGMGRSLKDDDFLRI